ncbi:PAS domain-containing protein, partial [Pseudomonas sp.]|uniref:PAS domain-containing protein n=1 Tax=Pseudomonas sp. TaxID=306 RepID=UPI003569B351
MANTSDKRPPLPHIPALDPAVFEKTWNDAPRLLAALNGAQLGAWYWDVPSGQISWSRGAQALFGLDPTRPLRTRVDYIELIPEEDRHDVLQMFQAVLDGVPSSHALQHRIRWPDGSLHWLEISGSLQVDDGGRQKMFGVIRDITTQQQRAQALRNSEQRFANLFHLSPDAILLVRFADSVITEANQNFASTFGWPADEVIGRSTLDL